MTRSGPDDESDIYTRHTVGEMTNDLVWPEIPFDQRMDLGPGSFLWRWAGDNRLGFTGLAAGILQLMHPGLGAGVVQHSAFFTEPWDRIFRSIPEIIGVIYDGPEAEATGLRVRDYHRRISGTDDQGRRYSALEARDVLVGARDVPVRGRAPGRPLRPPPARRPRA